MKSNLKILFLILAACFWHVAKSQDASAFTPQEQVEETTHNADIFVVAHRGAHNQYPENSFPAIREAIRLGVDFIEIDIRHTKDGHLVLMHDKTIDRTTNGTGLVADFTYDELKSFRLKNPDETVSDELIPLFRTVLDEFKGKTTFVLDVKTDRFSQVMDVVENQHAFSSSLILVYDLDRAVQLHAHNDQFRILMWGENEDFLPTLFAKLQPEAVHITDKMNSVSANRFIQAKGSRSYLNALGNRDREAAKNPEIFQQVYKNGANIIQTDYPELLLPFLHSQNLHK